MATETVPSIREWPVRPSGAPYARPPIDNNAVERAIRPATLGRKNWLFVGIPRGARAAGIFLTLIDSAKGAGLNTWDYFLDVISRIGDHPAKRLEELLPDNWKPAAGAAAPEKA